MSYQQLVSHTHTKKTRGRQGVKVKVTFKMIFQNIIHSNNNGCACVQLCGHIYVCVHVHKNIKWVYNYIPTFFGYLYPNTYSHGSTIIQSSWFHCWITLLATLNSSMFLIMSTTGLKSSGHFHLLEEALQRPKNICVFFRLL